MKTKRVTLIAIIASVYVCLSLIMGNFSYGPIQIRIAEVLMVLCVFDKNYILPLTLGCFLANMIGLLLGFNYMSLDIIFGSFSTLISGILMYKTRNIKFRNREILSMFIPCVINGLIIGTELALYTNVDSGISLFITYFGYIFLSEFLSVFVLGLCLYKTLKSISTYISEK